ncbi:hypothetical protein [Streptomyces qinglanensis]|uniref:hypothetical protein n=1 Tax=Streptomyces qinglanensis TaxID=943816 RepID=UPI003D712A10
MLGEDYHGGAPNWQTVGWCTSRGDARRIARAYTAHDGHYTRADVVEHGTDFGVISMTTDTYLPAPDASERPRPVSSSSPRPASPDRSKIPEPAWHSGAKHPPDSSCTVPA